jgi:hypothetical protein
MSNVVTDSMRDAGTPDDVVVTATAREPVTDATLGIAVAAAGADAAVPANRLVTIGDSLTQGFQSGAVFHTDLSWPAIVAWELGWYDQFRKPVYGGPGGLPLNIELLLRDWSTASARTWTGGSSRSRCSRAGSSWMAWRTTGSAVPAPASRT